MNGIGVAGNETARLHLRIADLETALHRARAETDKAKAEAAQAQHIAARAGRRALDAETDRTAREIAVLGTPDERLRRQAARDRENCNTLAAENARLRALLWQNGVPA